MTYAKAFVINRKLDRVLLLLMHNTSRDCEQSAEMYNVRVGRCQTDAVVRLSCIELDTAQS